MKDQPPIEEGFPPSSCSARFIVIGHGESYITKICRQDQIVDTVAGFIYDPASAMPKEEREQWERDIANIDEWWITDPDLGPVHFKAGIGETDNISIWRVMDEPAVSKFYVERFGGEDRGWLRSSVADSDLDGAISWGKNPAVGVMKSWPWRIVRVDTITTETVIDMPNDQGHQSQPGAGPQP